MKKIEAIIRPERLQAVQDALDELGVSGLTVSEVVGCGRQKGYTEQYRGSRAKSRLLPKIRSSRSSPRHRRIGGRGDRERARTGEIGDGRVFVYPVEAGGAHPAPTSVARTRAPRPGGALGPLRPAGLYAA